MTKKQRRLVVGTSCLAVLTIGAIVFNAVTLSQFQSIAISSGKTELKNLTRQQTLAEGLSVNIKIQEEGTVLLKNKNLGNRNMLPLVGNKVTVLGSYSHNYIQGGTGSAGGKDDAGTVMLDDALYDADVDYNEEAWEWLDNALGGGNNVHNGLVDPTYIDENDPVAKKKGNSFTEYREILEFTDETYRKFVTDSLIGEYNDTAIVTFGRSGAEGASPSLDYDGNKDTTTGRTYLELTDNEKDLLKFCKEKFTHTIVLINSAVPMECGFLDNPNYNIDAALWIGHPGEAGIQGVANILAGKVNPSGHLVDTWAYDMTTTPSFYSANNQQYSNIEGNGGKTKYYQYNEGIYVGYRYYETAADAGYFDSTAFKSTKFKGHLGSDETYFSELSTSNTYEKMKQEGPKATYSGYGEVIQYPFGYGLSYTTFTQEIVSSNVKLNAHGENEIKVKVTNTGNVSGKDVVQIYKESPYNKDASLGIDGVGLEKPKVELVGFAKTEKILEPGESEEVIVKFSTDDIATFDVYGQGSYVLEKGEYIFHVSPNAHGWANDVNFGSDYGTVKTTLADTIVYKEGQAGERVGTYNGVTTKEEKVAVNAMNDITAGDGTMLINGGASGTYKLGYLSRKDFASGMKEIMSYQSDDLTGKYSGNGYVWSADGEGTQTNVTLGKLDTTGNTAKRQSDDSVKEQIELKPSEVTENGVNKGKTYNYGEILAEGIAFGDGKTSKTLYGYGNDQAINMETTRDGLSQDDPSYLKTESGIDLAFEKEYFVAKDGDELVLAGDGYVKIFDTQEAASKEGVPTKLQCEHLSGVPATDVERWDKLANELKFLTSDQLFGDNAWHQVAAEEVGKVASNSSDGPGEAGNAQKNDNTWWNCAVIIAATWNEELAYDEGVAYGHQDILNGTTFAYAPAMNIHRTQFGGRNFEYYSEDGLISGIIGGNAAEGMISTGIHVFIKHMALNDSDTNRNGVNTWADEQSIREIYGKPYEYATKYFGADGIMGSLNSMGMAWSHSGFYQDMIRDEWGWNGMLITDGDGSGSDTYNNYSFWCFGAEGGILGTGLLTSNKQYKELKTDGSDATNYQKYMLHNIARNALYQYSHNLETLLSNSITIPDYAIPGIIIGVGDGILAVSILGVAIWTFKSRKSKKITQVVKEEE